MSGFYNYDTRGASPASQIVNLERMLEERDARIEALEAQLRDAEAREARLKADLALLELLADEVTDDEV